MYSGAVDYEPGDKYLGDGGRGGRCLDFHYPGILSALCTGLNIYQKLVKFGGAGALVPITGFANSVAAPAVEFRSEGQVFGIGVKIFTIAGPVILYGVGVSWILGMGYWVLQKM